KIGTQVAEEKSMFKPTHAKKVRAVRTPKHLNIAATRSGYAGASQAVGPVFVRNTSLNPLPCASAFAIFPVSCWKGTIPSTPGGTFRASFQAKAIRAPIATITIRARD